MSFSMIKLGNQPPAIAFTWPSSGHIALNELSRAMKDDLPKHPNGGRVLEVNVHGTVNLLLQDKEVAELRGYLRDRVR